MMHKRIASVVGLCCLVSLATSAQAKGLSDGFETGSPNLKLAGPIAFAPEGILLIGDSQQAAVFAIQTDDVKGDPAGSKINIKNLATKIGGLLGVSASELSINDLAVNPISGNAYLSISRGRGPSATPAILRVDSQGKLSVVSLKKVKFAKATLGNAPADAGTGRRNRRRESITDLSYIDGKVYIAGLSNEEFASKLRFIAFPFKKTDGGASVEIFHGAHGRVETRSPVRTFTSYKIKGKKHVVAAYTCTPLVTFPIEELEAGKKVVGKTVAELGNHNRPLDMFVYEKNGTHYILMANSSRGVMKIDTTNIATVEPISQRINGKAGLKYETIEKLKGVVQLDRLNKGHALVLISDENKRQSLQTIPLP